MTDVVFRPRIGQWVVTAVMITFVVYIAMTVVIQHSTMPYPFGVAVAIGGANLAWNLRALRKFGLRIDAAGIRDLSSGVALEWGKVTAIALEVQRVKLPKGDLSVRVARLTAGDREIQFADLGPGRPARVGSITNLEAAALVLAVATARSRATALYPERWTAPAGEAAAEAPVEAGRQVDPAHAGEGAALLAKAGPKVGAIIVKLAKTLKLGSVALTIGVYSLILSWKFAFALVGMVAVHECGHVYAMWKSNVPVKGIYFLPFFGGAAVSEGIAKTRARTAYIAINGPIWGTALALACFIAFAIAGAGAPFLGTLAAWGAFINLFNLMPVFPLDGGRIIASLVHASPRARPALVAILVVGAAIAYLSRLDLLMLVAALGLLELGARLRAASFNPALGLLGDHPLGADEYEHFARHVAFVQAARDAPSSITARRQLFERTKAEADQTPMTLRQTVFVLTGYVLVIGVLITLLFLTANIAGAGSPLDILR